MSTQTNSGTSLKINRGDIIYFINSFVTILLMFGFRYLPAPDPITPIGMEIAGIFIGAVYGWTTVGAIWPSILGLVCLGLTDYSTVKEAFMSAFGNDTVVLVIYLCIFCQVINESGIATYFSEKLVSLKIVDGRP